ncbi:hypothetical protein ACIREP_40755, partial [Streptomyces cyaneofuscatus]
VTEYGANSIPVRTETKDVQSGARQLVENTPTGDGKAIARTVTKAAKDDGDELELVSSTEFDYHSGDLAGEVAKTTVSGDPSAKGGDPGPAVTSTISSVDKDAAGIGRRTTVTTGPDGVESTSVSDLASGDELTLQSGDLGGESTQYDIKDRPVRMTDADGAVTTVSYEVGEGGSSVTVRREADGFATRTVGDELGRTVATESNYKPTGDDGRGEILPEGRWRQTSGSEFNTSGQQTKATDAAGRETTTEYDAWGLPAKVTQPDGTQIIAAHDDVAGTKTTRTLPSGAEAAATVSVETMDEQGKPVKSETAYGDGTVGVSTQREYDVFGQQTRTQRAFTPLLMQFQVLCDSAWMRWVLLEVPVVPV